MGNSAIAGLLKRPWIVYVATIVAALLGEFAIAMPAHSADLYPPPYAPAHYEGAAYAPQCSPCGCAPCGCVHCGCVPRCFPVVHRSNVIERRWVHREYIERVFDVGGPFYGPYGGPGYGPGFGGVRPDLGYGGINYSPYPISYGPPRPPLGIPGPYYAGYVE